MKAVSYLAGQFRQRQRSSTPRASLDGRSYSTRFSCAFDSPRRKHAIFRTFLFAWVSGWCAARLVCRIVGELSALRIFGSEYRLVVVGVDRRIDQLLASLLARVGRAESSHHCPFPRRGVWVDTFLPDKRRDHEVPGHQGEREAMHSHLGWGRNFTRVTSGVTSSKTASTGISILTWAGGQSTILVSNLTPSSSSTHART
jgi:hypothetical protein